MQTEFGANEVNFESDWAGGKRGNRSFFFNTRPPRRDVSVQRDSAARVNHHHGSLRQLRGHKTPGESQRARCERENDDERTAEWQVTTVMSTHACV